MKVKSNKKGVRVLAIASGPIEKKKKSLIIGVVQREAVVEGVLSSRIEVDGYDSTDKIIKMLKPSKFYGQVRIIVLDGISLAGLNIVDVDKIVKRLNVHVVLLTRTKPKKKSLEKALKSFGKHTGKDINERLEALKHTERLDKFWINRFYIQTTLKKSTVANGIDIFFKSLRLAHMIARGVTSGVSKGRI